MKDIVNLTFKILGNGFLLFLILLPVFPQTQEERALLEKRKIETIKQIEYTRKLISNTRRSAEVTVNQINLLNINITNRESLIKDLENEILLIEKQIQLNKENISQTEKTVEALKEEYVRFILAAYRNIEKENYLEYIIGAQDINQGYQRLKQIKYINEYRKKIFNELVENIKDLMDQNSNLEEKIGELKQIMDIKETELRLISRERRDKANTINKLKQQERRLLSELREKQKIQKQIEEEIKKIIEEEILRAKEKNTAMLTPAERIISNDFIKSMGGLPWPVEKGIITSQFGEHEHPVIKGIKVKSNGIDINTVEGEKARSIFDGDVTKVIAILGANYTVIIKHGDFYTVYQNLINIEVKTGDRVRKNETIGTIYTDKNQATRLHFQIWREKEIQDPEKWLSKY